MIKVWHELRRFLKRSYTNQKSARKFELRRRLEQVLLVNQANYKEVTQL